MDKIIDSKYIQYTKYDKESPIEIGAFIIDWLDGIHDYDIKDVIQELDDHNLLNEKGKLVLKHFDEARKLMDSTFTPDEVKNDTTKGDM